MRRHGLRDAVNLAVALAKHTPNVADGGACRHRAKGDDLSDAVFPILLRNIANHLIAATILKVDVNVGHRDAVLVQEPLKRQLVVKRINWGDTECVGHDGARSAPSAGCCDPLLARKAHKVGNDEEVGGVPHLDDDVEFVFEPRTGCITRRAESAHEPPLGLLGEPALHGLPRWHLNVWDARCAELQVEVHHLRDEPCVLEKLRAIREERRHLFW